MDPVKGAQKGMLKPGMPAPPRTPPALARNAYGGLRVPDPKYLFGTQEEIDDREATGYVTSPAMVPPAFKQIVAGPTSKDLNSPGPVSRQGSSKFGTPRKYA